MKTLLAGFSPFGMLAVNPSAEIVRQIASKDVDRRNLVTEVLCTEFVTAGNRIRELIRSLRPNGVLALGVAPGARSVRLERVALNLDDCEFPDNAGEARRDRAIENEGPVAYLSTLPLQRLRQGLTALEIPVEISNHAGAYVCNHVFYAARHEIERLGLPAPCGLIHVPLMSEQAEASKTGAFALPLVTMVRAVEFCIAALLTD